MTVFHSFRHGFILLLLLGLGLSQPLAAKKPDTKLPTAAIASAHPFATDAGMQILRQGGNAFDAAVAVTAVLAVVEPYSSGIGGGGFYLLHRASDGRQVMLDARERAPLAASRDMYLDSKGKITAQSLEGPLSAGIPGIPAALVQLSANYGRLPLHTSLGAAIRLARAGFPVDDYYRRMAGFRLELLQRYPQTASIFLSKNENPEKGYLLRQPDLAITLEKIAAQGKAGFYAGEIADKLVEQVRKDGGVWSHEDLKQYRIIEREPITGDYKGWRVISAAPPSSGGVALLTMLNILQEYDVQTMSESQRIHHLAEAMRHAYRDRAEFLGDPDFIDVPVTQLTSKEHAQTKQAYITAQSATPSATLPPVPVDVVKGADTTHFSILDQDGNRVSATLSINYPFGSGYVVAGTGVLLNDEMDDFSAKPGSPNAYGLVGAEANAIAPGKRPLSSMSPTFVENGDHIAILGTPGGSRIITMVLLGMLEFMQGGDADAIVTRQRFHHQYLPDKISFEPGALDAKTLQELQLLGHHLEEKDATYGNMQAVVVNKISGKVTAASDPRGIGKAIVDVMAKQVNVND